MTNNPVTKWDTLDEAGPGDGTIPEQNEWHREQLWRKFDEVDERQAKEARRALADLGICPAGRLEDDPGLATSEANHRARDDLHLCAVSHCPFRTYRLHLLTIARGGDAGTALGLQIRSPARQARAAVGCCGDGQFCHTVLLVEWLTRPPVVNFGVEI